MTATFLKSNFTKLSMTEADTTKISVKVLAIYGIKYRAADPNDQDCGISESDNWKGAQQCSQSWECRGARLCERGGWCSGYDGCEGTPLPDQAPGLAPDH